MKKLLTPGYDLCGNSIWRVIRTGVMNKLVPLGNFGRGPGLRPALTLMVLHCFGRPIFWLGIRFERQLHRIYQKLRNRG